VTTELDALLAGEPGPFFPAAARTETSRALLQATVSRLARPCTGEARAQWYRVLAESWWPALDHFHEVSGSEPMESWEAVRAAVARSMALLCPDRSGWLEVALQGTRSGETLDALRRRTARSILLLDHEVRVCPVFVDGPRRRKYRSLEDDLVWRHDGPTLRGHSHTLMLGLLADGLLDGVDAPVAATGELHDDGTVSPVRGMREKSEKWWQAQPDGILITGPATGLSARDLFAVCERNPPALNAPGRRWIAGGSLEEIRAKLAPAPQPLCAWDGRPIELDGLVAPSLFWPDAPDRLDTQHRVGIFEDAAVRVSQAPDKGGVLLVGPPGCGKSILSQYLERHFRRGPLGGLGMGVRVPARRLGALLETHPEHSWPDLLSELRPDCRGLVHVLARTRRLVPILDGLDELAQHALIRVVARLRDVPGWWVATGRPVRDVVTGVGAAITLELEALSVDQARAQLEHGGRPELAQRLFGERRPGGRAHPRIRALSNRPLHLSLLARVLQDDEELSLLTDSRLYRRVYEGLLGQARADARVDDKGLERLRALLPTVVGELALEWLRAASGFLDDETVTVVLADQGVPVLDHAEVMDGLCFGHLLARAHDDWEFTHRTLAEWAASRALVRQVKQRLRRRSRALGRPLSSVERADEERAVYAPWIEAEPCLPGQSRWTQLLRFSAGSVQEPLGFLRALVGPRSRVLWRVPRSRRWGEGNEQAEGALQPASAREVLDSWRFVCELGAKMTWSCVEDAQTWWGMVARWHLNGGRSPTRHPSEAPLMWADGVAKALPTTWGGLVKLTSFDTTEQAELCADPRPLLPLLPTLCGPLVVALLDRDSVDILVAAASWLKRRGHPADPTALRRLMADLPGQLAELDTRIRDSRSADGGWTPTDSGRSLWDVLRQHEQLETLVWSLHLRDTGELPKRLTALRMRTGPRHLEDVIKDWMSQAPRCAHQRGDVERRELIAAVARSVVDRREVLDTGMAYYRSAPYGKLLVGSVLDHFRAQSELHLGRPIRESAARVSWEVQPYFDVHRALRRRQASDSPRAAFDELVCASRELVALENRLSRLVRALPPERVDAVVGTLWSSWPAESSLRAVLQPTVVSLSPAPAWLPVALLREGYPRERAWSPTHIEQIRALAESGAGEVRMWALLEQARIDGVDERVLLLRALPTADDGLQEKIRRRVGMDLPAELIRPEELPHLPLSVRALHNVPGWRLELLQRLADPDEWVLPLVSICVAHGVREALPTLVNRLEPTPHSRESLLAAIVALLEPQDHRLGRTVTRFALTHGWPGQRRPSRVSLPGPTEDCPGDVLAAFVELEDLPLLSSGRSKPQHSTSLRDALRALGPNVLPQLRVLLQQAQSDHREAAQTHRRHDATRFTGDHRHHWERGQELKNAVDRTRTSVEALSGAILAVVDPRRLRLCEVVDLAFEVLGGDVRKVYSTPGPLGSDFDEPADRDWFSEHQGKDLVLATASMLETALLRHPEDWGELRRLFSHPSETLRKSVFLLARGAAPRSRHTALAIEALEGHLASSPTRWEGETLGIRLAGLGGSGTVHVHAPDTARTLIEAVRSGLTPADREVVAWLCAHERPRVQVLGLRWAAALGDAAWLPIVGPLLADSHPAVVVTALQSIQSLAPTRVSAFLSSADRSRWTHQHDHDVLGFLVPPPPDRAIAVWPPPEDEPTPQVDSSVLLQLTQEALQRLGRQPSSPDAAPTVASHRPGPLDRVVSHLSDHPALDRHLQAWRPHPDGYVRASVREALTARGDLTPQELLTDLQTGTPVDRVSAGLCLLQLDHAAGREEVLAVLEAAVVHRFSEGSAVLGIPAPAEGEPWPTVDPFISSKDLRHRIASAGANASALWGPRLLVLVLDQIHIYREDMMLDGPSQRRLNSGLDLATRWGPDGVNVLLDETLEAVDHQAWDWNLRERLELEARRQSAVLALLTDRAEHGDELAAEVCFTVSEQARSKDLDALYQHLRERVWPPSWC